MQQVTYQFRYLWQPMVGGWMVAVGGLDLGWDLGSSEQNINACWSSIIDFTAGEICNEYTGEITFSVVTLICSSLSMSMEILISPNLLLCASSPLPKGQHPYPLRLRPDVRHPTLPPQFSPPIGRLLSEKVDFLNLWHSKFLAQDQQSHFIHIEKLVLIGKTANKRLGFSHKSRNTMCPL